MFGLPWVCLTKGDPESPSQVKADAINPSYKSLNSKNVKKIHQAGYKIFPYTVNLKDEILKVVSLNVDGIITDFPERVNEILVNR